MNTTVTGEFECIYDCLYERSDDDDYLADSGDVDLCALECGAAECGADQAGGPAKELAVCMLGTAEGEPDGCEEACAVAPVFAP